MSAKPGRANRRFLQLIAGIAPLAMLAWPLAGCSGGAMLSPKVPTPTATAATTQVVAAAPSSDTPAPQPAQPTDTALVATASATSVPLPTATLTPPDTATPAPTLTETVTITPTATATLTVTALIELVGNPECPNPQVCIEGAIVTGHRIEFSGTAAINNMAYFKFEYQGADETGWHFISQTDGPVQAGSLCTWDASILAPGQYRVALTAVDKTGNYPSPSVVEIRIVE